MGFHTRLTQPSLMDPVQILNQKVTVPAFQVHNLQPLPFSDKAMDEVLRRRCANLPSNLADLEWDFRHRNHGNLPHQAHFDPLPDVQDDTVSHVVGDAQWLRRAQMRAQAPTKASKAAKSAEEAAEEVQRAADELESWTEMMRKKRRAQEVSSLYIYSTHSYLSSTDTDVRSHRVSRLLERTRLEAKGKGKGVLRLIFHQTETEQEPWA